MSDKAMTKEVVNNIRSIVDVVADSAVYTNNQELYNFCLYLLEKIKKQYPFMALYIDGVKDVI